MTSTTYNFAAIDLGGQIDPAVLPGAGRGVNPPCGVFAVPGNGSATVFFSRDTTKTGLVYTVKASTGQVAHGTVSPIVVPGLTNGTPVSFTAVAHSTVYGASRPSLTSDAVTPSTTPGVIHYVDPALGSDSFDGLSPQRPLKTMDAAQALTLNPGDAVLLKRGSTLGIPVTAFNPASSGVLNNPITLAAYGEGPRPVFDWGTRISGWASYNTQPTVPEMLTNAAMEAFITANGQTIPASWAAFVGSGGGSIAKSTTIKDTGSTASAQLNYAGGSNQLRQVTGGTATAGINYTWTTRIATDSAGVTAGANLGLQVRAGDGDANPFVYLLPDGTWTSDATVNASIVTPTAAFATYTVTFTVPSDGPIEIFYRHNTGSGFAVYVDNASLHATTPPPPSPNTYRVALGVPSAGFNPAMLYRNGAPMLFATDNDRLPDQGWGYDGTYLYYRQDYASPVGDGASYIMSGGPQGVIKINTGTGNWVVRDLAFRYTNGHNWLVGATQANCVVAETYSEYCGGQTAFLSGPNKNANGVLWGQGTAPVIRGNVVFECQTDGLYLFSATNAVVTDNVVIRVEGPGADCFQADSSDTYYVARNFFDQTNTRSHKGCIVCLSPNGTIEDNILIGGNFGLSLSANGCSARRNRIYNVTGPAAFAAGIYSENGDVNIANVTVQNNLVSGCRVAMSVTSGTRTNWTIAQNTFVDSAVNDLNVGSTWSGSTLHDNLFYSPLAAASINGSTAGLTQSNNTTGTNPLFVAPDRGLYTLQAASPAKGTGTGGIDRGVDFSTFAPGPKSPFALAP